jgi:hypothetical protein
MMASDEVRELSIARNPVLLRRIGFWSTVVPSLKPLVD